MLLLPLGHLIQYQFKILNSQAEAQFTGIGGFKMSFSRD